MAIGTWIIRMEMYRPNKMAADLMIDCLQQCEDLLSHVRTFCHEIEGLARASPDGATLERLLLSVEVALTSCVLLFPSLWSSQKQKLTLTYIGCWSSQLNLSEMLHRNWKLFLRHMKELHVHSVIEEEDLNCLLLKDNFRAIGCAGLFQWHCTVAWLLIQNCL